MSQTEEKLGIGRITAYALPAMPIAALGLPLVVHLPPFYITIGLSSTLVGVIFLITRLWDVFTDPIMGWIADRSQTRWGRRRPWIVASVPIIMLASYMVFLPPVAVGGAYLLVWMLVLYVGWTMLTISHLSWGSELSPYYHQRSRVQGGREACLIVGMILVLSLPALIQFTSEGAEKEIVQRDALAAMGWFIIILLPITVLFAVSKVPEKHFTHKPVSWGETFRVFMSNRALRYLLGTDMALAFSLGVVSSMFLFLIQDVFKLEGWVANILLLCYFVVGVSFVPVFVKIADHFGKHKAQIISSTFTLLTLPFVFFVPEGNTLVIMIVWSILGVNMGAGAILLRSMTADVCDEDRIRTGSERMGLFYAMLTMTSKIGLALSIGIIYPLIGALGFVHGGENSSEILLQMKFVYVAVPTLMNVVAIILMMAYPLSRERQEANRKILDAQQSSQSAG